MYSELLMGALVAIASPQDRDVKTNRVEMQEPATIEIEIPSIDIPEFDIYIPAFEFRVPNYYWAGDWGEYEIYWDDLEVSIPEIQIEIPEIHFDVGYWSDDDDWDVQDTETDTIFEVNPKAVLAVRNHAGDIVIRAWDRNQVRIEASHSSHDKVKILQSESAVKIKSETRHGVPDVVDYEITIPKTMPVDLWGLNTDVSVNGVRNGVRVETMSGDIDLRDVEGELSLRSVEGDITLVRGNGSFEVNGVEGDISVIEFEGDVYVESIDGDISLEGINSDRVEAKTVDGDVQYQGPINDNGRYRLTTHDGDVIVAVPANANATISVATFDGEFEADFPVQLEGAQASRKFTFAIGNGSARVELHSFDGDIRLVRR